MRRGGVGAVVRYTLMRILVFLGVLCVLWLVGLRGADNTFLLLALSLLVSMVVSYFLLRPFRDAMTSTIADRIDARGRRGDEGE